MREIALDAVNSKMLNSQPKPSEKKGVRQSLKDAKEKAKIYNDIRDFHKEVKRDQPSL